MSMSARRRGCPALNGVIGLRAANARLRQVIQAKDTEISILRAQAETLRTEVAELRGRLAQNSRNSSRPPSSDGLGRPAPKSLRKKTGRKPGRPKGQPGATMELTGHPDHVLRHEPSACRTLPQTATECTPGITNSSRPIQLPRRLPVSGTGFGSRPWCCSAAMRSSAPSRSPLHLITADPRPYST